jgi:hypothetical protein
MEVRETAACGVAEREFAIDLMENEIVKFYKFLDATQDAGNQIDADLFDDMIVQIRQVVGPAVDM